MPTPLAGRVDDTVSAGVPTFTMDELTTMGAAEVRAAARRFGIVTESRTKQELIRELIKMGES